MKFIISILLIGLLGFVAGLFIDWWGIALGAFLVTVLIHQRPLMSFLSGFIGIFLLWGIIAWWIDLKNDSILSHRMAKLLPLGGSTFLMILVTALIGGLVGGSAALTGSFLRKKQ